MEPNYICSKCHVIVEGGMKGFQAHMRTPDHLPPYICGHCSFDYAHLYSLYVHLRKHHQVVQPQHGNQAADAQVHEFQLLGSADGGSDGEEEREEPSSVEPFEAVTDCDATVNQPVKKSVNLARTAERVLLNLRSNTYMTGSAIKSVQKESFTLMQDTSAYLKEKVEEFLKNSNRTKLDEENLLKAFSLDNPFKHLQTKSQQLSVFKEKYGLREPQEIFLGYGFDSRQHPKRPRLESRRVMKSFQYVSVKDILRDVLSDPYLRNLISQEKKSTDGYMRSFKDGTLYETLPEHLKDAIRIILYIDDLEITQALSPAAGEYKIAGFYFGIQNLPPELNAMLTYIFVTALAFADDTKNEKVWEPFLQDMRELETEGININIDGEEVNFKAVLVAQIGDSLAASEVLGFLKSSANKFCRWCYIERKEMWADGCMLGEPRTPERHEQDVEAAGLNEANRTATGVGGPPMLHGLSFFNPIGFSVFDCFHDCLQGICKMEVKLALRHYVCKKKYFDLAELKSRVKFFDYGFVDKLNRPRDNFTEDYLRNVSAYNLHQSGAQMWCLTRAFAFLFADLVPDDDPFIKLISLLNQMMTIIFSHAVSESDIRNLEKLTEDHHKLFKEIFPGQPEPTEESEGSQNDEVTQQQEEQDVEDPGFQDFYDSDDEIEIVEQPVNNADGPSTSHTGPTSQKKKKSPKVIRMINKHHHVLHYPQILRLFGPLVLYWCIRYEARHLFFKIMATISHNYKNVLKTLMDVFQMKVAADKQQNSSRLVMGVWGTKLDEVDRFPHCQQLLDIGLLPSSKIFSVERVTFNGVHYRPHLFVTVALQNVGSLPKFARIENIYVPEGQDNVYLITTDWKTVRFSAKYCAFEVEPEPENSITIIRTPSCLPAYRLLAIWKPYYSNKQYLAPRTIA